MHNGDTLQLAKLASLPFLEAALLARVLAMASYCSTGPARKKNLSGKTLHMRIMRNARRTHTHNKVD